MRVAVGTAEDVDGAVRAARTFINTHAFESLNLWMPFGGIKQSGIGREFGDASLSEYVEEHSIRRLK